jgi:TPR repeat protein
LFQHVFFSLYRCRTCRQRFSVISRNTYYAAVVVSLGIVLGVVGWSLKASLKAKFSDPPIAAVPEARFVELASLAGKDDAVAQYKLARMYRYGEGVAQNKSEAWTWLQRAAEHGNTDAQLEVAMIMLEGRGVIQDHEGGLKWLRNAADGGNPDAQHELGLMYFAGQGVPQDHVKAYVWLNLAAAGGVIAAARTRDTVLRLLSPAQLAEAQSQARRYNEGQRAPGR